MLIDIKKRIKFVKDSPLVPYGSLGWCDCFVSECGYLEQPCYFIKFDHLSYGLCVYDFDSFIFINETTQQLSFNLEC